MTNTYRWESGFGIEYWVEGGTIVGDEFNIETIDFLSQTTAGNVAIKGISGEGTKAKNTVLEKKGSCCYIAAKTKQQLI